MRLAIIVAATAGALVAGCAGVDRYVRSGGGVAAPEGSVASIVAGGLMENEVGASLEEGDRVAGAQAEYRALEYGRAGQPVSWRNRASENYGEIVVGAGYQVNRLDCREFDHTIYVGGRARVSRGTACRDPSGSWRAVT
jgi:surface antigen